jgi:hypothetical protein
MPPNEVAMSTLPITPDPKWLAAMAPHTSNWSGEHAKRIRDEVDYFARQPESLVHTVIIVLANAYLEVACADMYLPEMQRHWIVRRTVDLAQVAS